MRKLKLEKFLHMVNPNIFVDIFELHDPVGIAGTDGDL